MSEDNTKDNPVYKVSRDPKEIGDYLVGVIKEVRGFSDEDMAKLVHTSYENGMFTVDYHGIKTQISVNKEGRVEILSKDGLEDAVFMEMVDRFDEVHIEFPAGMEFIVFSQARLLKKQ